MTGQPPQHPHLSGVDVPGPERPAGGGHDQEPPISADRRLRDPAREERACVGLGGGAQSPGPGSGVVDLHAVTRLGW